MAKTNGFPSSRNSNFQSKIMTMAPELEPKAFTGRSSSTIKKYDASERKYKNFSIETN